MQCECQTREPFHCYKYEYLRKCFRDPIYVKFKERWWFSVYKVNLKEEKIYFKEQNRTYKLMRLLVKRFLLDLPHLETFASGWVDVVMRLSGNLVPVGTMYWCQTQGQEALYSHMYIIPENTLF